MLGMAIASWFWNPIAFYVELGVCILSIVAVFFTTKYFHTYVQRIMQGARNALFGQDYRALRDLSLPLVIVGENEDIVWGNEAFLQAMGWAKNYHGTSLEKLIHPYTLDQLMEGNGTDIRIEDHFYTVFANRTEAGYLLYWVDDTAYKDLRREHEANAPYCGGCLLR